MLAGRDDPSMVEEACDIVLSRKALGAELLAAQRQAVAHSDDPQLTALMTRLAELRESSAQSSLAGMDAGETLIEIERVEWELASRVRGMDVTDRLPEFTHESAAALLPDASVLIEFVRFTRRTTISADPDALDDGTRDAYIAFVIPSGQGSVRLVDLGDAPGLDRLIQGYRSELTRPDSTADAVQGRDIVRSSTRHHEGSRDALRARLTDPLLTAIGNRTRVFVAPDGDLTRLPFEALHDTAGNYLIDTHEISYLSAGRDLVTLASRPPDRVASEALVLANPDYDLRGDDMQSPSHPPVAETRAMAAVAPDPHEPLRRQMREGGIRFADLPGTREEGIAVAGLLRVEPHLDRDASEERLKAARSPLVLHIATHGFFLPAPEAESAGTGRSTGTDAASRNPLVRSGIALAGANAWLRGEPMPAGIDDGVLTGEDILSIDLDATELVVLSACETGLGDIVAGEGVMGLRRAFAVAGARTLVLSLWKVPDLQTRMLMESFYRALLEGKGCAEALRQARLEVRERYPAPWYWAAFVCQGDPEPVPGFSASVTR
jgi:CHAT domain-containing protein